ncbi:hypothetical protein M885DRAFT_541707 [Pelagophyceae sp. CCMP2097]|nr:hypothetical protein M885DRAFT_541707 [Pelagophyceae sp. CCMP2097]
MHALLRLARPMSRLGGANSSLHARTGGLTKSANLNRDAKALAARVVGRASGDTGEGLTAAFDTALAKRRRDSAPTAVKAGAAGRERDLVESILCAYDTPPTKSPSESPEKKRLKGRCIDGAGALLTARRGKALHVKVRAAYNGLGHLGRSSAETSCGWTPTARPGAARSRRRRQGGRDGAHKSAATSSSY